MGDSVPCLDKKIAIVYSSYMDRKAARQTQTDRQIDRQTDRQKIWTAPV